MAAIKIDNNKCCLECGKNCNIHTHCWWERENDVAILKKFGSFLKVKHKLILRKFASLRLYPPKMKTNAFIKMGMQMFI